MTKGHVCSPDCNPLCGAALRGERAGKTCANHACTGQDRCRMHGGATTKAKAKGRERVAESRTRAAMGKLVITPVEDPLAALKLLAGEVLAWKDVLSGHIQTLELEQLRYDGITAEQVRGDVVLFERALDRCIAVLGLMGKLRIDERLAAVTEQQAEMLRQALLAAFDAAGLGVQDADQKERIARQFTAQLRLVKG